MFEEMIRGITRRAQKRAMIYLVKKYGDKGVLSLNFDDINMLDKGGSCEFKDTDDELYSSIKDDKFIFHLKPFEKSFFDKKPTKKTTTKKPGRPALKKRGRPAKKK